MKLAVQVAELCVGFAMLAAVGRAQPPERVAADSPKTAAKDVPAHAAYVDAFVTRMMAFDKNKDGKLTRDEITDERLLRLFDRADADHDGVVTKADLIDLATKMAVDDTGSGRRGGTGGGPDGGFGGPGGGPPWRLPRSRWGTRTATGTRPNPARFPARDAELERRRKEAGRESAEGSEHEAG